MCVHTSKLHNNTKILENKGNFIKINNANLYILTFFDVVCVNLIKKRFFILQKYL